MMEIHPYAEMLPAMPDSEYRELVDSIRDHGLKEPLWIYQGKIIDGRHRARACHELGITPITQEYTGSEPAAFVLDLNVRRRHLSPSQLAVIALEFMPQLQAEAKARKTGRPPSGISPGQLAQTSQAAPSWGKRARDIAAEKTGASAKGVQRAVRVEQTAPDLLPAIKDGTMTLSAAEKQASSRAGVPSINGGDVQPEAAPLPAGMKRSPRHGDDKQLSKALNNLSGLVMGLEMVNGTAAAASSPDGVDGWLRDISGAVKVLRRLKTEITGVAK